MTENFKRNMNTIRVSLLNILYKQQYKEYSRHPSQKQGYSPNPYSPPHRCILYKIRMIISPAQHLSNLFLPLLSLSKLSLFRPQYLGRSDYGQPYYYFTSRPIFQLAMIGLLNSNPIKSLLLLLRSSSVLSFKESQTATEQRPNFLHRLMNQFVISHMHTFLPFAPTTHSVSAKSICLKVPECTKFFLISVRTTKFSYLSIS